MYWGSPLSHVRFGVGFSSLASLVEISLTPKPDFTIRKKPREKPTCETRFRVSGQLRSSFLCGLIACKATGFPAQRPQARSAEDSFDLRNLCRIVVQVARRYRHNDASIFKDNLVDSCRFNSNRLCWKSRRPIKKIIKSTKKNWRDELPVISSSSISSKFVIGNWRFQRHLYHF